MEKEEGERKGSFKYYHKGYYYHKKKCNGKEKSDFEIFRCTRFHTICCHGTARENKNLRTVEIRQIHNHPPDPNVQSVSQLKSLILKGSRITELKPKHVFNKIVSQQPLEIGSLVNYNSIRCSIDRRRREEGLPFIPKYLVDFKDVLENRFEPTKHLFRGLVEAEDGSAAALFASDLMISLLNSEAVHKVEVDATFSVIPREMSMYQLFTVHIIIRGTKFCALWALMTRKTLRLYLAIWQKIILLAPELRINLKEAMSDFEPAIRKSITMVIPGLLKFLCCWFHYCQALLRRWKKLSLCRLKAPKDVLWMCMNLALAPASYFREGLQLIERVNEEQMKQFKGISFFIRYMYNQWLPLSKELCVFNNARTNNGVESFHKNASDELGGIHPNIYNFLRKMATYIQSEDMQYFRLLNGFAIRRNVPKIIIQNDINILHCQNQFIDGKMTLEQFLKTAVTRKYQENLNKIMVDNMEEEDIDAATDDAIDDIGGEEREADLVDKENIATAINKTELNSPDTNAEAGRIEGDKRMIVPENQSEKRKRGRPRKEDRKETEKKVLQNSGEEKRGTVPENVAKPFKMINLEDQPQKKKRGRPRKNMVKISLPRDENKENHPLKRKRGRPSQTIP